MRLYTASVTGTLKDGENVLLQVVQPLSSSGRARVLSWDVSFNGIIAGNSMTVSFTRDSDSGIALEQVDAVVLDGTYTTTYDGLVGPAVRSDFTINPTADTVIDGPMHASDPSFIKKQYASGREPTIDVVGQASLRCTPSNMLAAIGFKANIILVA